MKEKSTEKNRNFSARWSVAIEEHGYTSIPNLLFYQRKALNLSINEIWTLIGVISFKWDSRNPYPSLGKLSQRLKLDKRTVRRHVRSLEQKVLIKRIYQTGKTNKYSLQPLIDKLDQIAISSLPTGKKEPPGEGKISEYRRSTLSPEEDAARKDAPRSSLNEKEGIEVIGKIIANYPRGP
jgi:hypothetical protein